MYTQSKVAGCKYSPDTDAENDYKPVVCLSCSEPTNNAVDYCNTTYCAKDGE